MKHRSTMACKHQPCRAKTSGGAAVLNRGEPDIASRTSKLVNNSGISGFKSPR